MKKSSQPRGSRFKRRLGLYVASAMFVASAQTAAYAQTDAPVELTNDQIVIGYSDPASSHFKPLQARLKRWRYLEQLKEFLSPLRLPPGITLRITMKECGSVNSWWSGRASGLFLCYEFFDYAERAAPSEIMDDKLSRLNAILGGFLQVTFHELGHALVDIFDIPVFGREEDAADQIAGFIFTQFGPEIARRTLPGAVHLWRSFAEVEPAWSRSAYADEHGHPLQRAYNYLCLAYGADPVEFRYVIDNNLLPASRGANCAREFVQVRNSFTKTILPHLDRAKMRAVRAKTWLLPPASSSE